MPLNSIRVACILTAALLVCACTPDPLKEVALSDLEAYWVVDTPVGATNRIAPAVRFRVTSKGAKKFIEAQASFRRKSEPQIEWGNGFIPVTQAGTPMARGESKVMTLVMNEGHYTGPVAPEELLRNAAFSDVHVLLFIRVGSSSWVKMAEVDAERRIGSHALEGR
jgi:hypothetical protein